jgi:hypothetical protein
MMALITKQADTAGAGAQSRQPTGRPMAVTRFSRPHPLITGKQNWSICTAVLVAVGVAMPLLPTLLLLAIGGLALLWGAASRRVAVRVDAHGITLGGSPLRYRGTTMLVPWTDITNVLLWEQTGPSSRSIRPPGSVTTSKRTDGRGGP